MNFLKRVSMKNLNKFYLSKLSFKNFSDTVKIKFNFVNDNTERIIEAKIGDHILKVSKDNDLGLEGACDASLACSTCHVVFEESLYDQLEEPKEEEEDLLDLTFGLKETSRLGCQCIVSEEFDGATIYIPPATRNLSD